MPESWAWLTAKNLGFDDDMELGMADGRELGYDDGMELGMADSR